MFLSWTFPFCRIRQLKQLACPGKNWTIDSEPVIKTAASTGFNVPAHTLPINAVQNRSFNLHFCGPPCRAKDLNGFLGASMCDFPGLVNNSNLSAWFIEVKISLKVSMTERRELLKRTNENYIKSPWWSHFWYKNPNPALAIRSVLILLPGRAILTQAQVKFFEIRRNITHGAKEKPN